MMTIECSPTSARWRFNFRTPINLGLVALGFIPLVFILQVFIPYFVADIIGVGLASFVFFFVLDRRVVVIQCEHCKKLILTNTPWVCGHCGKRNDNVCFYPFIHHCEGCGAEPKAYRCHHEGCGQLVFLTQDEQKDNFAYAVNSAPPPSNLSVEESEESQFEAKKRSVSRSIELANLQAKAAEAEYVRTEAQKRFMSIQQKLDEQCRTFVSRTVGADKAYQSYLKELEIEFKDDPEKLERAKEALLEWLKNGQWEHLR